MIVATTTVLKRLELRLRDQLAGTETESEIEALMEQLIRTEGEEFDIIDAYRFALDERHQPIIIDEIEYKASALLEAIDPYLFSVGCNDNAKGEIQDSWLIKLDNCYYRLEGVTED